MTTDWMPPVLKGFLTDGDPLMSPNMRKIENKYVTVADGRLTEVANPDWDTYHIDLIIDNPYWEYRALRYKGFLEPPAVIAFTNDDNDLMGHHSSDGVDEDIYLDIPSGTWNIFVSYNKSSGFDFGVNLLHFAPFDVTDDVINWDETEMKSERDGLSGVFAEMEIAMQFRRGARDFLHDLFMKHGLRAKCRFEVHKRDDFDLREYAVVHDQVLEFTTYAEYDDMVEINGTSRHLTEVLNAFGGLNYDIPVAELSSETWTYEHNEFVNVGNWTMPEGRIFDLRTFNNITIRFLLNLDNAEMVPNGAEHDMKPQSRNIGNVNGDYFFEAAEDQRIHLSTSFVLDTGNALGISSDSEIRLYALDSSNNLTIKEQWPLNQFPGESHAVQVSIDESINVFKDTKLIFSCHIVNVVPSAAQAVAINRFDHFNVTYKDTTNLTESIPIIDPEVLLQKYLDLMSGVPGRFKGAIEWKKDDQGKDRPYRTMLVAAESIRGYENACLHGKYDDFEDWMRFLGYEFGIDGNTFTFRERDYYFRKDITALTLQESELADLIITGDDKYAWSAIKVGYDKQDYENTNGRFEPNGTYEYEVDYVRNDRNKSVYEHLSPYRADAVGIEILTWSRTKQTTDTKADNDIFMLAANKPDTAGVTTEYRDLLIRSFATDGMAGFFIDIFNAPFNPYFIVKDNESKFGINSNMLKFVGTDVNRELKLGADGASPQRDIPITKGLFKPMRYKFSAGSHWPLPTGDPARGLVAIHWRGKQYRGYIRYLMKNYAHDQMDSNWELLAVE